ncbi:MAG: LytTR family transcriptional regulator [OCS116 cluster bacterium]|nr:LytTR family transcriptional regulator [OCS116 cluster bacterium]
MRDKLIQKIKDFNSFPYVIIGIISLIVAQIAPYDTDGIGNFFARFAYWLTLCNVSWVAWTTFEKFLVARLDWPFIFIGSLCGILMTIPLLATIALINFIFLDNVISWPKMGSLWLQIFIVSQTIYALIYVVISQIIKSRKQVEHTSPAMPHFLKNIGGDLLYIKSEDHYLRIQTSAENKLILYKISDAIKQLDESHIEGMIIHRSHWVAKSAIKSHKKDGRKNLLILSNDDILPVSATYLKNLKAEGYV